MTEQELTSVVYELKGKFDSVEKTVSGMDKKLDLLPCVNHEMRIDILDKCMAEKKSENTEKTKANYSLRNIIVASVLSSVLTALCTLAVVILTGGTP
jgi:hypothetical protein